MRKPRTKFKIGDRVIADRLGPPKCSKILDIKSYAEMGYNKRNRYMYQIDESTWCSADLLRQPPLEYIKWRKLNK